MSKSGRLALMAMVAGAAGVAVAAGPEPMSFLQAGYLNLIDVVLPAPIPDEPRGVADRQLYKLTRGLAGTSRWQMAVSDVATDTPSMMHAFSCATRINMTPANAPKTAALLERASRDAIRQVNEVRGFYKKRRPFVTDPGQTCEPAEPLAMNYDYPSPSAARGWTWALILSELVDDRAAPVLARGRAYGESAVVCGTHSMSAVEAGRMVASTTLAVVRTEPPYQDAVVAARRELEALRKVGAPPSPQTCSAEELLTTQPIFR